MATMVERSPPSTVHGGQHAYRDVTSVLNRVYNLSVRKTFSGIICVKEALGRLHYGIVVRNVFNIKLKNTSSAVSSTVSILDTQSYKLRSNTSVSSIIPHLFPIN